MIPKTLRELTGLRPGERAIMAVRSDRAVTIRPGQTDADSPLKQTVRIDDRGRITIKRPFRDTTGIELGSTVTLKPDDYYSVVNIHHGNLTEENEP